MKLPTTFRALRYRNFRYLWLGQLAHSAAMWMEQVVRPLLILELTSSPLQVGLVVAARMAPQLLFGLLAGVVADRYDKRLVLLISQPVTLIMNLLLAVLLLTGTIAVWHVFVTAFVTGGSMAFNQPTRQSLIPRIVPMEIMLNAVSLNTAAMNLMRVLGAGLAGVLLIFLDYGQIYLLNALLFVYVIWTTARITMTEINPTPGSAARPEPATKTSIFQDLLEGFRYMAANRGLLYLAAMALIIFVIGMPYQQVFVPLLALNVLEVGRSGAGWMLALVGIGSLIGSLGLASIRQLRRRGLVLMGFLVVFGLALLLLSRSQSFPLSASALIIAGCMTTAYHSLNISLLLEQTAMKFQGRVMSLMSLDRGLVSVGAVISGALAESLGPQLGLAIIALACIVITVLICFFSPILRQIN
jgi:MFS transporter, DHA1 family, staphyloferrin A biosynthesis exporter